MNLLRVSQGQIINLDAIASISAGNGGRDSVLVVRYLVQGKEMEESGLAYEKFSGEEALALYQYFTDQNRCVDLHEWMHRAQSPLTA
jgi:hypothetical protein